MKRKQQQAEVVTLDGVEYEAKCSVTVSGDEFVVTQADLMRWEQRITKVLIREGARGPDAVRWLRKQARLQQDELGEMLGHNRNTVRRWESGEVSISPASWLALVALVENRKHAERRLKAARNPPPAPGHKIVA
jgi:DNA-binding XRE family transcriptional regulator